MGNCLLYKLKNIVIFYLDRKWLGVCWCIVFLKVVLDSMIGLKGLGLMILLLILYWKLGRGKLFFLLFIDNGI